MDPFQPSEPALPDIAPEDPRPPIDPESIAGRPSSAHHEEREALQHHASQLEEADLVQIFGPEGPLAVQLADYELRPSQVQMAEAVKEAILQRVTALVEAPTGTGKSIAYLLPALLSGRTVVIATANKSLQNQLYRKDIPFLAQVLGREIDAVMVKGRSNYLCSHKWEREEAEQRQFALYEGANEQVSFLRQWARESDSGDVDDLPFVLNPTIRPHVVSYPDDCLKRDCRHYFDNCFVNAMRDRAANAQVLITNHHLLLNALELGDEGTRLLPEASIYIIDEAHQLENTATAVFEVEVTNYSLEQLLSRAVFQEYVEPEVLEDLRLQNTMAFTEAENLAQGNTYRIEPDLEEMAKLAGQLRQLQGDLRRTHPYAQEAGSKPEETEEDAERRAQYDLALESLGSLAGKLDRVASCRRDDALVRYAERNFDRRYVRLTLHAAPIDPAGYLTQYLFDHDTHTVVCTSATLATNGHFQHFSRRCGVMGPTVERVLPAVFDYPRQALLYQPPLPAYSWRNKEPYYDAVAAEIQRLLEVSRGRALCLFTSWSGLQQVADRLRHPEHGVFWPLQAQGDAPRNGLLAWFVQTPHSVLLATRSFWEGVDLPGEDLSLVVLDKMPFPTPNDPVHSARMQLLDQEEGQSSFGDYMLPLMTLTLKQGFGRLIRRSTDRGVVAILDERLTSKGYGRQARNDLPPAPLSRALRDVHAFFQDGAAQTDFALNVRAWISEDGSLRWRWQLLRLQDGKSDSKTGQASDDDHVAAEITAALAGLQDLKKRIDRAGRKPNGFGVELRCSQPTAEALAHGEVDASLRRKWVNRSAIWGHFDVIGLVHPE